MISLLVGDRVQLLIYRGSQATISYSQKLRTISSLLTVNALPAFVLDEFIRFALTRPVRFASSDFS